MDKNKETKNIGDYNTGNYNSGNFNSGYCNSGHYNSGNFNSGCCNSGNCNSGNFNSGHHNTGNYNSGHYNSGNCNNGHYNSGHCNSGDFNKSSANSGCFNTSEHKLLFFDSPTDMTFVQWRNSQAYKLMSRINFQPTKWVIADKMTDEEKEDNPEYETAGGYLKACDTTDCFLDWWEKLNAEEKEIIKQIPNFNADKFLEITGIDVRED